MYGKVTGPVLIFMILMISLKATAQKTPEGQEHSAPRINIKTIPPNAAAQNRSFFCRQELKVQKASGLPIYLRLGNKDYVDYLERKGPRFSKVIGH